MGLRNWLRNQRMVDPMPGNYRLTWRSELTGDEPATTALRCTGVVEAFGLAPVEVSHRCLAESARWPSAGQTLPVLVDRADPTRLRIQWDRVGAPGPLATQPPAEPPKPPTPPKPGPVHPKTGRPVPGTRGGGTTPRQAERAQTGGGKYRSATAIVLAVADVPTRSRRAVGGVADLTLGFRLDDEEYTATTRIGFRTRERRGQVAVAGHELPVLVDPRDPSKVVVDVKAVDRWHQG